MRTLVLAFALLLAPHVYAAPTVAAQVLYVAGYGGSITSPTIAEYATSTGSRLRTIARDITAGFPIAVDAKGDLYAVDGNCVGYKKNCCAKAAPAADCISVFTPGSVAATQLFSQPQADTGPRNMAFDSKGNLYVANAEVAGNVCVYAAGTHQSLYTIVEGAPYPGGLAFDSKDDLYVPSGTGSLGIISVYAPSATKPMRKIELPRGLEPSYVAFDRAGDMFASAAPADSYASGAVLIYPPGGARPAVTLENGGLRPLQMTFDSRGRLYVLWYVAGAGGGEARVYSALGFKLLETITCCGNQQYGSDTPFGFALDASDRLYVGWFYNRTIGVYAPPNETAVGWIANGVPAHPTALAISPP